MDYISLIMAIASIILGVVVALDLGCGNTKNSEYESK